MTRCDCQHLLLLPLHYRRHVKLNAAGHPSPGTHLVDARVQYPHIPSALHCPAHLLKETTIPVGCILPRLACLKGAWLGSSLLLGTAFAMHLLSCFWYMAGSGDVPLETDDVDYSGPAREGWVTATYATDPKNVTIGTR